nr:urease accessory UreF family protein [Brucella sp. HL-2]
MDLLGHASGQCLIHLMRLVSPNHPVGAFSYSRGLEWAVQAGIVKDKKSCAFWVFGLLEHSFAALDAPIFIRIMNALGRCEETEFFRLNDWLIASRESREIELEDRRMGESLLAMLRELDVGRVRNLPPQCRLAFPSAFAIAAHHWCLSPLDALRGLMWSVIEGQVTVAIRIIPLGHTAGQKILIEAAVSIERAIETAFGLNDDEIGNTAPYLAMASAWHETLYSRLFRS